MAKIVQFEVSRGMTIMDGFDADKPHFGMVVKLEDNDDFYVEVAKAIQTVNGIMMTIPESGMAEE